MNVRFNSSRTGTATKGLKSSLQIWLHDDADDEHPFACVGVSVNNPEVGATFMVNPEREALAMALIEVLPCPGYIMSTFDDLTITSQKSQTDTQDFVSRIVSRSAAKSIGADFGTGIYES